MKTFNRYPAVDLRIPQSSNLSANLPVSSAE
jgi:hypothetical protein